MMNLRRVCNNYYVLTWSNNSDSTYKIAVLCMLLGYKKEYCWDLHEPNVRKEGYTNSFDTRDNEIDMATFSDKIIVIIKTRDEKELLKKINEVRGDNYSLTEKGELIRSK